MADWYKITAKFNSTCLECLNEINAGDTILWLKGTGTKHVECPQAVQPVHELEVEEDYSTWCNPQGYAYNEVKDITRCQKCNARLTAQTFIDASSSGDRKICENCFDRKKQ